MIPVTLQLTNFLSYRDTVVLDFAGIRTACIAGANGAGKSSILDGITWALFGQSRGKSDDDVINRLAAYNGEAAEVRYTFALETNQYRVIRQKQTRKSTRLDLQLLTESGKWKSLSENRVRDTQAAIENLLKMNYDTFINASFLLQGKADEFTTKTANKRKEILADLIGVNQWDQYKEAAAVRRRETEGQLQLLDARMTDIDQELDEETERAAILAVAQEEESRISERLADKEQLLTQLRRVETAVQHQRQAVHTLANNVTRARQNLTQTEAGQARRQQELDAFQALLDEGDNITARYAAWQGADATWQTWQGKETAFRRIRDRQRPHELAIAQAQSRLQQRQAHLEAEAARVAAMRQEQEEVTERLRAGRQQLAALSARLEAMTAQETAWHEARARLQALEHERKLRQQEVGQLQTQWRRLEREQKEQEAVAQNRTDAQAAIATLTEKLARVNADQQALMGAMAERDTLQAEQPPLKEQMDKLKERITRLEEDAGSECPLCGQPLTAEHRRAVLSDLRAEGENAGNRYRQNQARVRELGQQIKQWETSVKQRPFLEREHPTQQQRLAAAEARLAEIEAHVTEWQSDSAPRLAQLQAELADDTDRQAQQHRVGELALSIQDKPKAEQERLTCQQAISAAEARLAEITRASAAWETAGVAELAQVRRQLAAEDFALEERTALAALDAEAAAVGYDPAAQAVAQRERAALADAPAAFQELKQAEAAVKPLSDTLSDLAHQLVEQRAQLAEMETQHQAAAAQLAEMTTHAQDVREVEQDLFRLREDAVAAHQRVGAARQRLDVLTDLRQQQRRLMTERADLTHRVQRLKLLEKACGRDGVQALLIEQALPEIETSANDLLERLTDGQMRVTFDTQRQLKTRDEMAETLDIRIVDNAGERPYENFSGGEQFRVNFAIRLALSRVLAKRAGARLQTLVIDEGFGSQDPQGRQRLVEAINTIQGDFACILVITHIDQLRDAFPTRIQVEKSSRGSAITVN
ncbi:MAG: SMC family ATPase [Anaerolineales bacterium]|nr:SMC family ATPase [Anaerolineales bacterium]MCB8950456.1 SMC family ATPase [Ardenticatenales bacterium]